MNDVFSVPYIQNETDYDERFPVIESVNRYGNTTDLCYKILSFLLDFPYKKKDGTMSVPHETGYRADLIKYLYYDDANPLAHELPTLKQKKSLIFNPGKAQNPPDAQKGYRIYTQSKIIDVQTDAKNELRIYPYMVFPKNSQQGDLLIAFECWSNMEYYQLANFQVRTYNMAQCIIGALNGRNITGIGGVYFDNGQSGYCRIESSALNDNRYNLGHRLIMGVSIAREIPQ